MKTLFIAISAPLLFVMAFVLVIAFYINFRTPPEVEVMTIGFVPHSIEITEGEMIRFVNRSSTTQMLCLGSDQRCDRTALLPRGLTNPGARIAPDQAKDVLFDTYGTFAITSTAEPGLNLTVTVDAALG
jgi:plastocyanin